MKPQLELAVSNNRIGKLEAEIFSEVITALENLDQRHLASILQDFKVKDDELLLSTLKEFNIDFDKFKDLEDEEDVKRGKRYVIIDGKESYQFAISLISTLETDNYWDEEEGTYEYRLVLNKDETGHLFCCNTVWRFWTEEQRDWWFNKLKLKLEKEGIKFI